MIERRKASGVKRNLRQVLEPGAVSADDAILIEERERAGDYQRLVARCGDQA